jgi:hypothetical protein
MQASSETPEPLTVVLDCELGRNVDNALTLALLYGLSATAPPQAEFTAVSLTRSDLRAAAFCDAVARFYSKIALRNYPEWFQRYRGFSVGLDSEGSAGPSAALAAVLDSKTPAGEPLYPHETHEIFDTADPLALVRNALTAEADGNCGIVLAGSAKNLAGLLTLNGALELVKAKVRFLAVAMDPQQVRADSAAARKLFAEWPTPIVAVRPTAVRFPPGLKFAWIERHPVADALEAAGGDAGTAALAAALHLLRPDVEGFSLSEPGAIRVNDDGTLRLEPAPSGSHRMLTAADPALVERYRDIITAEPTPREPPDSLKTVLEREKEEAAKEGAKKKQQP